MDVWGSRHETVALDKAALHGMKNGFQPVTRPELLVYGVEVISQSWRSYPKIVRHFSGVFRVSEKLEDALLLL